jgi:hypothetical protein
MPYGIEYLLLWSQEDFGKMRMFFMNIEWSPERLTTPLHHSPIKVNSFSSSPVKNLHSYSLEMDITQEYAIVLAGTSLCFLFWNLFVSTRFMTYLSVQISRRVSHIYVIDRHGLMGPWSAAGVLLQMVYLTMNLFCLCYRVDSLSNAGRRAGTLSLINLGPLLGGFHLDFLASLSGLSLKTIHRIHRSASFTAFSLAAFHVLTAAATENSAFRNETLHPFVIIVRAFPVRCPFELTS